MSLLQFSLFQSRFPCFIIVFLYGKSGLHVSFFGVIDDLDKVDSRMVEFDFDVGAFL